MPAASLDSLRRHEIPGRVAMAAGHGGLPKVVVTAPQADAEIYLHGAHVTHFQKPGEPPLIFMSRKSAFAPAQAIRGGVPICFPWFGNRDGEPSHGFARTTEWQLVKTSAAADGAVTVHLALPRLPGRDAWKNLRAEFVITVANTLSMELEVTNESCNEHVDFETCLHTYFQVGDITAATLTGLEGTEFLDNAAGGNGERKLQNEPALAITRETNRIYLNTIAPVEIHDQNLKRVIRVEKFNSRSTIVWNPWTTQKLPDDFDPAEHRHMLCVESGNVKQNHIALPPGQSTTLKVVVASRKI